MHIALIHTFTALLPYCIDYEICTKIEILKESDEYETSIILNILVLKGTKLFCSQ